MLDDLPVDELPIVLGRDVFIDGEVIMHSPVSIKHDWCAPESSG
jgi:hypothetical protein